MHLHKRVRAILPQRDPRPCAVNTVPFEKSTHEDDNLIPFFEAFQQVIELGTKPETAISLEAPFVEWSKTDIVERGLELGVPYEHTWSCYRDEEPACGTCDSCAFRLQAFQRAGVKDPIEYAERPVYNE